MDIKQSFSNYSLKHCPLLTLQNQILNPAFNFSWSRLSKMVLSAIFRRSASSLANQIQANYSCAIFNNTTSFSQQLCPTTYSSMMMMIPTTTALHFSSISTIDKVAKKSNIDDILQDLDYQIECYTKYTKPNFPLRFPFEVIQDDPREKTITLTRKYEDEVIKVEVHAPYKVTIKGEETSDSEDDREEEQERFPLVISVSKGNGTVLEFGCTVYFGELSLDSITVRKKGAPEDDIACEGPELHRLPVYLDKVFYKYLEIRGIDPNNNAKYYDLSNTDYLSTMMEAKNQ